MIKRLFCILLLTLSILIIPINAQDDEEIIVLEAGDPPLVERLSLLASDTDPYTVIISGEAGSVFPSAQVAVRNVYTSATTYAQANFDGSFSATVAGIPQMPYQINTDIRFDQSINPQSLAGIAVILHPNYDPIFGQDRPFALGGHLSYGAGIWYAEGTINAVDFAQGDNLIIPLDVTFLIDDFDPNLDYVMRGELGFRRYFDENGTQLSTAIGTGDNWSSELTRTGLPILGRTVPDTFITEATTDNISIDDATGVITFSLEFESTLLDELLSGIYMPIFTGEVSVNDSEFVNWHGNRIFSTDGQSQEDVSSTIIPLVVNLGDIAPPQLKIELYEQQSLNIDPILRISQSEIMPRILGLPLVMPLISAQRFNENVSLIVSGSERLIWTNDLIISSDLYRNIGQYILSGTVVDSFNNVYIFDETVPAITAQDLVLNTSYMSGTPSYALQSIPRVVHVSPAISAEIRSSETRNGEFDTFSESGGQANRFGYFYDDDVVIDSGSYRFNLTAEVNFQDELWFDYSPIIGRLVFPTNLANGVYGLADYSDNPQAWFDTASYPTDAPDVLPFVNFPYFSGDVAFIPDGDNAGINPVLSGGDYQYLSIVRADGVVRQFVRDSNSTFDARLSNDDLLNGRIGAGSEGNRPEDVLWLFGAVVDENETRGYSSIAVVTDDASARVVPPFTEPLLYDRGEPVDLFVLPTGVRAGQVLETGDTFAMIGYLAPTVSADITTTIITPSESITNTTQASPFGYFYEPEHDFTVTENGIYRVYVDATYAGETSAGLLPEPVYGTVLGADDSSYLMFVVDRDAPYLVTNRESVSTVASGQAFSINLSVPDFWTDVSASYVVRTPQWILEQGDLSTFSNQATYNFNWAELARLFPSLEAFATDPSDMDEVTLSFAMTGFDGGGIRRTHARIFTLRGNTLYTAEE